MAKIFIKIGSNYYSLFLIKYFTEFDYTYEGETTKYLKITFIDNSSINVEYDEKLFHKLRGASTNEN